MTTLKIEYEKQRMRFEQYLTQRKKPELFPYKSDVLDLEKLYYLSIDEKKDNTSLHAIWLLEKYLKAYPEQGKSIYPKLITDLPNINIEGSQRIAGNIIIDSLKAQYYKLYSSSEKERIIETAFEWLITTNKAVAVIANAFEILYYFVDEYDWVEEELSIQITAQMKNGTAAVQSRGKKILNRLAKKKR